MGLLISLQSNKFSEGKKSIFARKLRQYGQLFNLGQSYCLFCVDVKHITEEKTIHKYNLGNFPTFLLLVLNTIALYSLFMFSNNISLLKRVKGIYGWKVCLLIKLSLHKIIYWTMQVVMQVYGWHFLLFRNEEIE
jgi:hypothetical protein